MAIWQLCANLLIPNCLRSNLSYSPLAALELYVNKTQPLLMGTKRAQLLGEGKLREADITLEQLMKAEKVSLINAMIELGEREIAINNICL